MVISIVMAPGHREVALMWNVELNIAGIRVNRWARKRRHLLRPMASPLESWMKPSRAA